MTVNGLLALAFCIFFGPTLHAQGMPFTNNNIGKTVSVSSEWSDVESDVGITDASGTLGVPIFWRESTAVALNLRAHSLTLERSILIADRGLIVPKHFGGAEVGASAHFTGNGFNQGFSAAVGSTGRKLFDSNNARSLSATYFREWKNSTNDTWYFFLSYANNRSSFNNIPLPGFGFARNRETYRYFVGLPIISGSWMPGHWRLTGLLSPFTISSQLGYVIKRPWQITTGVAWLPRSFQNIAPDIEKERLIYDKKEWSSGVTFNPAPPISASLLYVYQYDRRFYVGRSTSDRRSDAIELADGGGMQLRIRWVF